MAKPQMSQDGSTDIASNEDLLCYCLDLPAKSFRQAALENPNVSYEKLCEITGVGTKCTSCLLNAEYIFEETSTASSSNTTATLTATTESVEQKSTRRARDFLYGIIDRAAPQVARRYQSVTPVLSGAGFETVISFSNEIPDGIEPPPPPFHVDLTLIDAMGQTVWRGKRIVEPGTRLDEPLQLPWSDNGDNMPANGSIWAIYRAARPGYKGSIRPHFAINTDLATACVHGAGGGRRTCFHATNFTNTDEVQYVSAINMTGRRCEGTIKLSIDEKILEEIAYTLPPYGASLIEMPDPKRLGLDSRLVQVQGRCSQGLRWHYAVRSMAPASLSFDHI